MNLSYWILDVRSILPMDAFSPSPHLRFDPGPDASEQKTTTCSVESPCSPLRDLVRSVDPSGETHDRSVSPTDPPPVTSVTPTPPGHQDYVRPSAEAPDVTMMHHQIMQ